MLTNYKEPKVIPHNAKIDACDYLDIGDKIDVSNNDLFILQLNIRGML